VAPDYHNLLRRADKSTEASLPQFLTVKTEQPSPHTTSYAVAHGLWDFVSGAITIARYRDDSGYLSKSNSAVALPMFVRIAVRNQHQWQCVSNALHSGLNPNPRGHRKREDR
jgi:hypothetical protein